MIKSIDELFELLPKYGGYHVALVDEFDQRERFVEFAKEYGVYLHLKEFALQKSLKDEYIISEKFSFEDRRYNPHSVIYDYVYLCCDIEIKSLEEVVKKFYRTIKNAGYLYLFAKSDDVSKTISILEESNYVSINDIDEFLGRRVISAQKMHGWKRV